MTLFTISIPKDKITRINKAAARKVEIESGLRRPVAKVHKSLKTYTRKSKHKSSFI